MSNATTTRRFPVRDYDLEATLTSGQAFRWKKHGESWVGVIGRNWVRLQSEPMAIIAETTEPVNNWSWLVDYLQLKVDLNALLLTFPDDAPMREAVHACHGLRLLRQDPWECLASFILSSTKQIVQIQQIIGMLCERFGEPIHAPSSFSTVYSFPSPARLARATETQLRGCKMGFRAPYLLAVARAIANGKFILTRLNELSVDLARKELVQLPGVGAKIADCVLLFAYGAQTAFPVDVWVSKALRELYFPGRRLDLRQLHDFAATHFGSNAGYAQQYLFHYMRMKNRFSRSGHGIPFETPVPARVGGVTLCEPPGTRS